MDFKSAYSQAVTGFRGIANKIGSVFGGQKEIAPPKQSFEQQMTAKGWSQGPDKVWREGSPAPKATPIPTAQARMVVAGAQAQAPQMGRPSSPMPVVNNFGRNPEVVRKPAVYNVKAAIEQAANEFQIPASLLYDIGFSEGGFRSDAANETPEGQAHGVPRGLFQFTPYTWDTIAQYASNPNSSLQNWMKNGQQPDRNDPVANARAAAYLIKMGQLGRWQASKSNWGRFYTEDEIAPYYAQTEGYVKGQTFR